MIHPQCWPRAPHQQNPALESGLTDRAGYSEKDLWKKNAVKCT